MAGFLRKRATLSRKPPPSFISPSERRSSDAPPSLPPLLLSSSLSDPDPIPPPALPPAASPPVVALPTPAPEYLCLDDAWDPWKAYTDAPGTSTPRLDGPSRPNVTGPSSQKPALPQPTVRKIPPFAPQVPLSDSSIRPPRTTSMLISNPPADIPDICNTPASAVATAAGPRVTTPRQAQSAPQAAHPKSEALGNQSLTQTPRLPSSSLRRPSTSPAAVRGPVTSPSSFDFEESLSAANVTSVVNQFRSYPPPIPHHASPAPPSQGSQMATQHPSSSNINRHHTPPQKPGSSSSLSSGSHHTDATRGTKEGSYGASTSASSVPPAAEVIDVSTGPGGRLDAVGSSSLSAFATNGPSPSVVGRSTRAAYNSSAVASRTSRPFTSSNVTARVHRSPTAPPAPPTSYPERVRTLARPSSHASLSSSAGHEDPPPRPPMLYDILRSGNPESAGSLRKGPLIFAAMSGTPQPNGPGSKMPVARPSGGNMKAQNPYPSPPAEYASLEASPPTRRKASISSVFRDAIQIDLHPQQGLGFSPTSYLTELPPLDRKSSKSSLAHAIPERTHSVSIRGDAASEHSRPRVLTKARPTTPQKPSTPSSHKVLPQPGDPLLLDDDPFARVEGVKMLKPRARSGSRSGTSSSPTPSISREYVFSSEDGHVKMPGILPPPVPKAPLTPPPSVAENIPSTPLTPDDYKVARQQRRGQWLEKAPPPAVAEIVVKQLSTDEQSEQVEEQPREATPPPTYFPILAFLSNANLLPVLLSFLSYSEWLALYSANKQVRELFKSRILREFVLERHLSTVGYSKWNYEWAEPLELSVKDLHNYLRGVAMPAHQYARLSAAYLQPDTADRDAPTCDAPDILALALTTRAYTRVVLRLRAQAESEARYLKTLQSAESAQTRNTSHPGTHQPSVSSRAPSPTSSNSHSHNHSHAQKERNPSFSSAVSRFRSPLYRVGRAPVLRVFVPSPEGDWLSDASVVECEAELKRSGVLKLLRVGDIVWDVAVGDEGNQGRLMWDGSYLVDLDYKYSRVGELSPYFHSLAFSPSYFHRVIRIGGSANHNPHCNPIVYIDISPWGREIAANLQLLQDRARTETPHGALHDVVRWVHRSQFTIRPPVPPSQGQNRTRLRPVRVPIPNVDGFYIDPGWYGTVVLESEGTNEGLTDLQARCGPGVFPPRAESIATKIRNGKEKENRRVWRILREKSRPGEIWLRAVQVKEQLM